DSNNCAIGSQGHGAAPPGGDGHDATPLGTRHCPYLFQPTASTVPSALRPTVCEFPVCALPAATVTSSRHPPTSHWPYRFSPVAITVPSLRSPTECRYPAAIAA